MAVVEMTSIADKRQPVYALRRDGAAAALSISPSLFDTWVKEGMMPLGHRIKGVVLWDAAELHEAWIALRDGDGDGDGSDNPFDGVVA